MQRNKKSIYTILTASYALMLALYISTILILYLYNMHVIKNETTYSNLMTVENMQQSIDNIFTEVNRLNMQISINSDINTLLSDSNHSDTDRKYRLQSIRLQLSDLLGICNYVNQFCVYAPSADCAVTPTFTSDCDEYLKLYLKLNEKSISDFKQTLADTHSGSSLFYSDALPDKIIVIQCLPLISENPDGYILVSIDKNAFVLPLHDGYESGNLYIADSKKRCIPLNSDSILDGSEINFDDTISWAKLNGEKYCFVKTKSSQTGYNYLCAIKASLFAKKLRSSRNIGFLLMAIYSILALFLAKMLLKYNYSPLDRLVKDIHGKLPELTASGNNEYAFIGDTINRMLGEKRELSHSLQIQNEALRHSLWEKTLKTGITPSIPPGDVMHSLGINAVSDHFIVGMIQFEDLSNLFAEDHLSEDKKIEYALLITQNILEELLSVQNDVYFTVIDVCLIFCVNIIPQNCNHILNQLKTVVSDAAGFIQQNFNFGFLTAISSIRDFEEIHTAYREANIAMEYAEMTPDLQFVAYSKVINQSIDRYSFTLDAENRLVHLIKSGNRAEVEKFLDEIFSDEYQAKPLSLDMFKCLMFDVAGSVIKTAQDIFGSEKNQPFEPLLLIEKITDCVSTSELKQALNTMLEAIYSNLPQKDDVVSPVIELVSENYTNPDLSVAYIAEKVHLHPNYLSSLFKKQHGIGLLEYITNVRIEKSKQLLTSTALTLDEIAVQVGYTGAQPLSRAFKKKEGVPPSIFRSANFEQQKRF